MNTRARTESEWKAYRAQGNDILRISFVDEDSELLGIYYCGSDEFPKLGETVNLEARHYPAMMQYGKVGWITFEVIKEPELFEGGRYIAAVKPIT